MTDLEFIRADEDTVVESSIRAVCERAGLEASSGFLSKCMQLYGTLGVRHGLMMVGGPLSGKTTVLKTLAKAMSAVSVETQQKLEAMRQQEALQAAKAELERIQREEEEKNAAIAKQLQSKRRQLSLQAAAEDSTQSNRVAINGFGSIVIRSVREEGEDAPSSQQDTPTVALPISLPAADGNNPASPEASADTAAESFEPVSGIHAVQFRIINPKSLTLSDLYGSFDVNTHEWSDGVLAVVVRQFARDSSKELKWVVFDGPVDAIWVEVSRPLSVSLHDSLCMCSHFCRISTLYWTTTRSSA